MGIIQVINGILSMRIVQYALVGAVLVLSILSGVQSVRLYISHNQTAKAQAGWDLAKASIAVQNASILTLKTAGDARVKQMIGAVEAAKAMTEVLELKAKNLQAKLASLPKNDCQGAVNGFIKLIPEIVGGK
jgi:hypothetical protein